MTDIHRVSPVIASEPSTTTVISETPSTSPATASSSQPQTPHPASSSFVQSIFTIPIRPSENQAPPSYEAAKDAPAPNDATDEPPSYNTMMARMRRVKQTSANTMNVFSSRCETACESVAITACLLFSIAIPVTMIVLGSVYLNQCPYQPYIPVWLVVFGSVACFSALVRAFKNLCSMIRRRKNPHFKKGKLHCAMNCVASILEFFLFAWFICGNVWVYSIKGTVNLDTSTNGTYCQATVYLFSFWIITIIWILIAFMCCLCCCGVCILILISCLTGLSAGGSE